MSTPSLLPSGLMDVLPPFAAGEFRLVHTFLKTFMAFGYQPVIPPLAEYASGLLAGAGEATSHHVFKMPDALSAETLAVRADMTGQVSRIAGDALGKQKRPLRLCYAGYTLRTAPEALKTRRQHTQVGIERFGDMRTEAVAEVLAIATHALESGGLQGGLTIDLHYPAVLEALLKRYPAARHDTIRDAVRLKDHARLQSMGAIDIAEIMRHAGSAHGVLQRLEASNIEEVATAVEELRLLVEALDESKVEANLSIDLLDLSGYGYYTGIGYAVFWNQGGIEVGRGGCYRTGKGEDAVGFTLYINDVLEKLPTEGSALIKNIPYGTSMREAQKLQAEGYTTVFK